MTRGRGAAALAAVLLLTACGGGDDDGTAEPEATAPTTSEHSHGSDGHGGAQPTRAKPLRPGEQRLDLTMSEPYTPSAPTGVGTDDYRCFLLDPELERDAYLTGTHVQPGNAEVVHHVILFRVPPEQVASAEAIDAQEPGQGWTCFGGTGLDEFGDVDDAPWLGAWAPGGQESVFRAGYGVELDRGSRIVMQVHYNLLAGDDP